MESVGLGIDAGGSSSRWLLLSSRGTVLGEGRTGPLTGHIFGAGDDQLGRFVSLLNAVKAVRSPDALVAGITGLHPGTVAAELFAGAVSEVLGLGPERRVLRNDMHVAYASAFSPGEGVLVYAGTGSVAYHESVAGEIVRAGGYGYLIDDAGGGYWIGHRALRALFRAADAAGRPADTPLAELLYARLGSRDWPEIMPVVYGGGRGFVASLAPAVAEAERAGDALAKDILERAGAELARLARDVLGRLGASLPVAFAGGVTRLPVVTGSLEAHLGAPVRVVEGEPVYAAARLALRLLG
jgi:glucosamine kinase